MRRSVACATALAALAALCAVVPAGAAAEEPLILVLAGEKVSELQFEGKTEGTTAVLETVGGKTVACAKGHATATAEAVPGKEADTETGHATIDLEGCKKGSVACRSETKGGAKDPVETVLLALVTTGASDETAERTLGGELVASAPEPFLVNCGVVKVEGKGSGACSVAPVSVELAAGETATMRCRQEKGKQLTGTCIEKKATCEKLAAEPLLASLGNGFEGAGLLFEGVGTFNKMIFGDV